MPKDLICIKCGNVREIGRRICSSCNKKRLIELVSNKPRYMWLKVCKICMNEFRAWRKPQKLCSDCNKLVMLYASEKQATNNYILEEGILLHRQLAEKIIGRLLKENEIVHHIDQNPENNSPINLLVMYRKDHIRLHVFLNQIGTMFRYYDCEFLMSRCIGNLTKEWFARTEKFVLFL